ncbi:MAG TPA: hypothetical protein VM802_17315 [Chitinophaga sp.]|uniref:hypothetical protein n=1 Tax=Chitinophaga sp. TaxID=1869181 RepID=UPI002C7BD2AA|nr:hypothetical protein [Chitinophaga sp.]HVI46641.1 hypothetical protein [Chitinophaga sp.]
MGDKSAGNIILISRKYVENGEGVRWNSQGDTTLNAAKAVKMHGHQDGVKFGTHEAVNKQNLLVKKVEGPFDEKGQPVKTMYKEKWYVFKATEFSRKPTDKELGQVNWARQLDDGKIEYTFTGGTIKNGTLAIQYKVNENTPAKKASVYAYFQQPTKGASAGAEVKEMEPVILFVNGYWNKDIPMAGPDSGSAYWGNSFRSAALQHLQSSKPLYINGADTMGSSGSLRFNKGRNMALARFNNPQSNFYQAIFKEKGDNDKYLTPVCVVTHSMGAAYGEGIISFLKEKGVKIKKVVHFSPADVSDFNVSIPARTFQIDISIDPVLLYKNMNDATFMKGILAAGMVKNPSGDQYGHMYTKTERYVWQWLEDLESIQLNYVKEIEHTEYVPSLGGMGGASITTKKKRYRAANVKNGTQFIHLKKNSNLYKNYNGNDYINW